MRMLREFPIFDKKLCKLSLSGKSILDLHKIVQSDAKMKEVFETRLNTIKKLKKEGEIGMQEFHNYFCNVLKYCASGVCRITVE